MRSLEVDQCRNRHRQEGWPDQRWQPPAAARKAIFHWEKGRGRKRAIHLGAPESDAAIDCAPLRFPPCATPRTPHAAVRSKSREMTPTLSLPRCHCGPDGRASAVLGTCGDHELARSGRQTSAALQPARTQDVASGAGGHAGTKSVLLCPAAVIGLERTLHEGPPRSPPPRRGMKIVAS